MTEPQPRAKDIWRGASPQMRQVWRNEMAIIHPRIKRAIEAVDEKIARCARAQVGDGIFIQGETGSGKTWLIRYMLKKYHSLETELPDRKLKPVITFKIPAVCTPKQLCISVLTALGDEMTDRGTLRAFKRRVSALLNACQVKLVLLDDLQDLPLKRRARGIESVASCIRDMIDESTAVFVMLGNHDAAIVLNHYHQIRKRAPYRTYLKYFDIADKSRRHEFKVLMHQLDAWLPMAESSCITEGQVAGQIFCATNGVFQFVLDLLDWSWPEAVKDGRESIERKDLAIGFRKLHGDIADVVNPFTEGFAARLLNQPGEPFHGWPA